MTQDNNGIEKGRRSFLKRSTALAGGAVGGLLPLQGVSAACNEYSDNYNELSPFYLAPRGDQFSDDTSGTEINAAGAGVYWESHQWPDGEWDHRFTSHAHAEHFENSQHYPGLTRQRWQAVSQKSANGVSSRSGSNDIGSYHGSSGSGGGFGDGPYTGLAEAISWGWPTAGAVMTAAQIVYSMITDAGAGSSPSPWDEQRTWDPLGQKACMSHYVKFDSEGDTKQTHVTTNDRFYSPYGSAIIAIDMNVGEPYTGSSSTTSDDTSTSAETMSTGETYQDSGEADKVLSVDTRRGGRLETKRKTDINERKYKEAYPEKYKKKGVPEAIVQLPVRATTTTVVAKKL